MKRLIFAALGAMVMTVTMMGIGPLAVMNLEYAAGRYPGSAHIVSERFDLLSVYQGHISQEGEYRTDDELTTVSAWYAGRYEIEPEQGMYTQGQCVRLAKVNQYAIFRRTIVVMLCSAEQGTRVYVSQTVYLQP